MGETKIIITRKKGMRSDSKRDTDKSNNSISSYPYYTNECKYLLQLK